MSNEGKSIDISALNKQINEEIGESVLMTLSSASKIVKDGLSSGSLMLNNILSGNPFIGYKWGRIVEIFGPESSGKTTIALHAIRECQKLGYPTVFIDAEQALDLSYAKAIGVDITQMSFTQPDYGEQAFEITEKCVKAGFKLIVIDSVAAMTPRAEMEGNIGDKHIGRLATLMRQACNRLSKMLNRYNAVLIFTNQITYKIGVMFSNPETSPGGSALKFYATYRIDVRSPRGNAEKEKSLDGETIETGTGTNLKTVKNKVYPPYRKTQVSIVYGQGIDKIRDVCDLMELKGITIPKYGKRKVLEKALETDSAVRKEAMRLIKESVKGE